jgi:hypothetical protein
VSEPERKDRGLDRFTRLDATPRPLAIFSRRLFIGFNIVMAVLVTGFCSYEPEFQSGQSLGGWYISFLLMFPWAVGAAILGLFALFLRR